MHAEQLELWLWLVTVGTAVAGGIASMLGAARQRQDAAAGTARGPGYRLVMTGYVLMTVSMVVFAIRGFL